MACVYGLTETTE